MNKYKIIICFDCEFERNRENRKMINRVRAYRSWSVTGGNLRNWLTCLRMWYYYNIITTTATLYYILLNQHRIHVYIELLLYV